MRIHTEKDEIIIEKLSDAFINLSKSKEGTEIIQKGIVLFSFIAVAYAISKENYGKNEK